jgi:Fe-S cluster biogenesis protein NfuA
MNTSTPPSGFQRIESLLLEFEKSGDPATQAKLRELVQSLLDYHGTAVRRLVEMVQQSKGPDVLPALAEDELISSLLLLYDLHPIDLRTRVELALDKVRPYLKSHGGEVELLDTADGIVQLRMKGSCHGCPSSAITMQTTIEQSIYSFAPDVAGITVEGVVDQETSPSPASFVSLTSLSQSTGTAPAACAPPQ